MSWSSRAAGWLGRVAAPVLLVLVAACSGFHPLYGDGGVQPGRYAFHYAEPGSRLDQVIYTELRLRLGPSSDAPDAVQVSVRTSAGSHALTSTATSKAATANEVIVTATATAITPAGEIIFSGTRSSSATYQTFGQVLADTEARTEAAERGATALADSLRLAILGALARAQ
jgi:LPS-assembly lipoprotein